MRLTERHYARWIPDGDEYPAPLALDPGEVPANLMARLTDCLRRRKAEHDTDAASAAAASC